MKKFFSGLLAAALTLTLAVPSASALELEDAKTLLSQYYYNGVPEEVLELDSLDAILEALGDPYTYYMTPEQYESFNQSVNGREVTGIGATVETAFDGGYLLLSVLPDSPALEAGLQPGDRLVAVDGTELTAQIDPRTLILGEEGTQLTVTVLRDGERLDFTMTRRTVLIPIVTYELVDGAAYLDCTSFGASTAATFQEAIQALDDDTAVWIVDLRSNPGGDSRSTAATSALFIGGGIMLYFRDGAGNYNYTYTYTSDAYPDLSDKPVIVLTSPHSASGAELFSGDIRDYGVGIAVGQRTFGKGTAQLVLDETRSSLLSGGEALKVTVYRFFSPDGATNHIVGVLPTLLVSEENTQAVGLLLSRAKPARAEGFYKLELAGQTFYLDGADAQGETAAAFTELLEALPPSAALYQGSGTQIWEEITPAQAARALGLTGYAPRDAFSDIAGTPYEREIRTLASYFLLTGFEDGTYRPEDGLTRAQFSAMLATALDLPAGEKLTFSDVSGDAWYAGAVTAVDQMGFLTGYGDGTFGPEDPLTYEQLATALSAVAAWASMEGYELAQDHLNIDEELTYLDWADWAQIPARNLAELGALPEGLTPSALADRGTAAGMLCRLMESIGLIWD